MKQWMDISVPLRSGMVHWPGDPEATIERVQNIAKGDECNVSKISMSAHTGTHMDAPVHYVPDGQGIDRIPLDAAIGPARVIEIKDPESIKPADLQPHRIRRGERLLFKTPNSARAWWTEPFIENFVFMSHEAAQYLAERGVQTVGVDYLSVGGFKKDAVETHRALLEAGVWIIEGLDLTKVEPGRYHLVCLPLKIVDGDGAPARALLRQ